MSINPSSQQQDEAQIILDALREIQDNPELRAEAEKNPEAVLDRLGLTTIARSAVAMGMTAMLMAPAVQFNPTGWWQ